MRRTAIALAPIAIVVAACGTTTSSAPPADDARPTATASAPVTTKIKGATPKQETILREILAGLGPTVLDEIRVAPAGKDWSPLRPNSVVLQIEYRDAKEGRGYWEAALLANAFATRSRILNLQTVTGYETPGEANRLEGIEEDEPALDYHRAPIKADEIAAAIREEAKESGADLAELRIVRPMRLAAAATLRVDDPAAYLKHRLMTFLEAIPHPTKREYDGLYVLVVDPEGDFVWLSAQTIGEHSSGGAGGARPDLAGCDPRPPIGGLTSREPPPCPAD
jgi:hypothetical protein